MRESPVGRRPAGLSSVWRLATHAPVLPECPQRVDVGTAWFPSGRGAGPHGRLPRRSGRTPRRRADACVNQHVARWQLPERWAFIEEVPKTSVGKFDKKVLRRRYAEGALEVTTI